MTDPRPDRGSERAGESEYGNDTGFATEATASGQDAGQDPGRLAATGPDGTAEVEPAAGVPAPAEGDVIQPGDHDIGAGAD